MSPEELAALTTEALYLVLLLSAPAALAALGAAALAGLLQSATQLQDPAISAISRTAAVGAALVLWGAWMGETLVEFTRRLWDLAG